MRPEIELEERARRCQGCVLRGVAYQGTSTIDGAIHATSHVVYLELDHGRIEIAAEDRVGIGHGVGIWLRPRKVIDPAFGAITAAGQTALWRALVGTPIIRATVIWADIYDSLRGSLSTSIAIHADYLRRRDYPAS
ncbi:MAG TPA: hypothetical protein VGC41_13545, partial [Kofleriaceae bacterium]